MAKLSWGRKARVYVHASAFTASGLIEVRRAKDITVKDEAKTATAEARDLAYDVNQQAGKTFELEFQLNIEAADDGTDVAALKAAYVGGTDLYVIVARDVKGNASGEAIKFVGQVFQYPDELAQGEASMRTVIIRPSDPDNLPTRVSTPLA